MSQPPLSDGLWERVAPLDGYARPQSTRPISSPSPFPGHGLQYGTHHEAMAPILHGTNIQPNPIVHPYPYNPFPYHPVIVQNSAGQARPRQQESVTTISPDPTTVWTSPGQARAKRRSSMTFRPHNPAAVQTSLDQAQPRRRRSIVIDPPNAVVVQSPPGQARPQRRKSVTYNTTNDFDARLWDDYEYERSHLAKELHASSNSQTGALPDFPRGRTPPLHFQTSAGAYICSICRPGRSGPYAYTTPHPDELMDHMAKVHGVRQIDYETLQNSRPIVIYHSSPRAPLAPVPMPVDAVSMSSSGGLASDAGSEYDLLHSSFKQRRQPSRFFKVGKVFITLWAEPSPVYSARSDSSSDRTSSGSTLLTRYGEHIYTKVRRFVVVREASSYCLCLPISTYSGMGVNKSGVVKAEHAIIYTGKRPPQAQPGELPGRNEMGMRIPIRVDPDHPNEKLDPMSRLDFGKVHTIQHNLKVKPIGKVAHQSLSDLLLHYRDVQGFGGRPPLSGVNVMARSESIADGRSLEPSRARVVVGQAKEVAESVQSQDGSAESDDATAESDADTAWS